jgi:hypothetical protein
MSKVGQFVCKTDVAPILSDRLCTYFYAHGPLLKCGCKAAFGIWIARICAFRLYGIIHQLHHVNMPNAQMPRNVPGAQKV